MTSTPPTKRKPTGPGRRSAPRLNWQATIATPYEDLVASGENLLAHGWNGDFLLAMEDNENIVT